MRFQFCIIGLIELEHLHIPVEARLDRAKAHRDHAAIALERLDHLDLFDPRRALTDLVRVCHEVPDFLSGSLDGHIALEFHVFFLEEVDCPAGLRRPGGPRRHDRCIVWSSAEAVKRTRPPRSFQRAQLPHTMQTSEVCFQVTSGLGTDREERPVLLDQRGESNGPGLRQDGGAPGTVGRYDPDLDPGPCVICINV